MGLCKCPKRKVTNLFCFEHRVNVCENCLVASHESCVVQTYLSWLTDSDYDSNCILCTESLSSKETIRLKCFHVFHWSCLNQRASQLPNTTTPAGYKCPSCLDVIFPLPNQTSPVIDKLREKLSETHWASGGLKFIASTGKASPLPWAATPQHQDSHNYQQQNGSVRDSHSTVVTINPPIGGGSTDSYDRHTFTARLKSGAASARDDANYAASTERLLDESPGDKYARKTSVRGSIRMQFARLPRRAIRILVALALLLFLYVIFSGHLSFFSGDGGSPDATVDDPMFDPHANPNIRIASNK